MEDLADVEPVTYAPHAGPSVTVRGLNGGAAIAG